MCKQCRCWTRLKRPRGGRRQNFGRCVAKPADNPFWMTPWSSMQLPVPENPCVTTHETKHGAGCAAFSSRPTLEEEES